MKSIDGIDQLQRVVVALALVLLAGCAAPSKPLAVDHPANPDAPEAVTEPLQPMLMQGMAGDTPEFGPPLKREHGEKQPGTYTCPMHPAAVSDKPGECPKCGMSLTRKGAKQ